MSIRCHIGSGLLLSALHVATALAVTVSIIDTEIAIGAAGMAQLGVWGLGFSYPVFREKDESWS